VAQYSTIGIDYDPILAKLIVWGQDRDVARARMIRALNDYKILGLRHSIKYLADIVAHDKFASGETYTSFIERHFADWSEDTDSSLQTALAAAAVINANGRRQGGVPSDGESRKRQYNPWLSMGAWRIGE
jgi:acetyl/propionyl-CoA carboxylase alpha subunit